MTIVRVIIPAHAHKGLEGGALLCLGVFMEGTINEERQMIKRRTVERTDQ